MTKCKQLSCAKNVEYELYPLPSADCQTVKRISVVYDNQMSFSISERSLGVLDTYIGLAPIASSS